MKTVELSEERVVEGNEHVELQRTPLVDNKGQNIGIKTTICRVEFSGQGVPPNVRLGWDVDRAERQTM